MKNKEGKAYPTSNIVKEDFENKGVGNMSDKKPINDAMDHMGKIEGYPTDVDLKKLPKPLRYFGYFMIGFFSIAILFILIAKLFT